MIFIIPAVIYARYSSANQTEQSIEGQVHVCETYAKTKDLKIIDVYADRAISGLTDVRPAFQKLIADSATGKFKAVIVYKTDRFSRNKYDSAIYKAQLKKFGIAIHYAAESIPDGPEGVILESLLEGLAEYYSRELSQKIRRGMHETAKKGKATGGGQALGYKISEDKKYVIDEFEAPAIKQIFNMYIEGKSKTEIYNHLNDLGFKTRQGKPLNKNTIDRIIQNEKYIGVYKFGAFRIEDGVPAIVSKEVFAKAQKELAKRKKARGPNAPRAEYLLIGKLFCGHCKSQMVGVSGTGKSTRKFYYYYCPEARAKRDCKKKQVPRDWLEDLIVNETIKYVLQPERAQFIANACYEIHLNDQRKNEDLSFCEQRLEETKKAIVNTVRAIELGAKTKSLPQRLQELEEEQETIEASIKRMKAAKPDIGPEEMEYLLLQFFESGDDWQEYKRKIINGFISQVFLYDNNLIITYNISKASEDVLDTLELEMLEKEMGVATDKTESKGVRPKTHRLHQTGHRFSSRKSDVFFCGMGCGIINAKRNISYILCRRQLWMLNVLFKK